MEPAEPAEVEASKPRPADPFLIRRLNDIVKLPGNVRLEEDLNPVRRVFRTVSPLIRTPASLAREVGTALRVRAYEERMRNVGTWGGFRRFRRATESFFNIIII